ncbi:hypothetical protein [Ferrovibrio sp.]|uniref:hypothetical protein n=1 Tax=Ferrovibrio sp. TaxID=1917215 RepID=UPI001B71A802|nr:hypothetical protein [Ferrovibrio sp.]MBP7063795.1 hypothetical protein [Ferrovibrio sp.]
MRTYLAQLMPHRHPRAGKFGQFRVGGDEAGLFLPQIKETFGKRIGIGFVIHAESISDQPACASFSALHRNPCTAQRLRVIYEFQGG